jgi:hypothetical protein
MSSTIFCVPAKILAGEQQRRQKQKPKAQLEADQVQRVTACVRSIVSTIQNVPGALIEFMEHLRRFAPSALDADSEETKSSGSLVDPSSSSFCLFLLSRAILL